jgi:2-polyprenyl-6-hydroxyphenyl methylase/3-demethylubiquinone-9 3-methyltransferase
MNSSSNVDQQEVEKFDRVSRLWWNPAGKMGMLHVINPLRADFIFSHLDVQNPKMVDIGCGGGILTEAFAKAGASATGVDQSQLTLEVARQHAAANGLTIDYRYQTAEQLAEEAPGGFDAVACMEMLEHVPDPAAVIAACAQLLKPGGKIFFSTINRNLKAFLFAIVGGEYILRILPRGTHSYAKLIRPDELRQWAAEAGLEFIAIASLMYNPFTRKFRVAHGREDVNYMASFQKKG